jgi:hypothetical protein
LLSVAVLAVVLPQVAHAAVYDVGGAGFVPEHATDAPYLMRNISGIWNTDGSAPHSVIASLGTIFSDPNTTTTMGARVTFSANGANSSCYLAAIDVDLVTTTTGPVASTGATPGVFDTLFDVTVGPFPPGKWSIYAICSIAPVKNGRMAAVSSVRWN